MNITEALEKLISGSPFIEEAINENIVNISSLARKLKPEVEYILKKPVNTGALIMAIKRRQPGRYTRISNEVRGIMNKLGDITVRSGLSGHSFENSPTLVTCQRNLMDEAVKRKNVFCTFSQGVSETTIVTGNILDSEVDKIFSGEKRLAGKKGLGSVTIQLPRENTKIPGIYYFILKTLAWKGINIREIISATNELNIVVDETDTEKAFPVILGLKRINAGKIKPVV